MKAIWDYKVTFPYGATDPPYSSGNRHKGDDWAAPSGTPVTVNGLVIGLVGSTGYSTGPHLHVGKWKNGSHSNPKGGGAEFDVAVVIQTGEDDINGKYVRINGDGYDWVYLHLSKINVKKGQRLDDMYKGKTAKQHSKESDIWKAKTMALRKELEKCKVKGKTAAQHAKESDIWKGKTMNLRRIIQNIKNYILGGK